MRFGFCFVIVAVLLLTAGGNEDAGKFPEMPFLRQFRDQHGRFLEGDLTQINEILGNLILSFNTSGIPPIDPIDTSTNIEGFPIFVTLDALISPEGDFANCTNIQILGDVSVTGSFDTVQDYYDGIGQECPLFSQQFTSCDEVYNDTFLSDLGDFNFYQRYQVNIDGVDISLDCDLDLHVILTRLKTTDTDDSALDIDVTHWNDPTTASERWFNFVTSNAKLGQTVMAYSPNFKNTTPTFARANGCNGTDVTDVGNLVFNGTKLLTFTPQESDLAASNLFAIAIAVGGLLFGLDLEQPMDLTTDVLLELEGSPELVKEPINAELCTLVADIAVAISELIVENPLTNQTGDFVISDPFTEDENGYVPALALEIEARQEVTPEVDLLDLTEDNFFVDLIFVDKNATTEVREETTLAQVLDFFAEPIPENGTETDPLLRILGELLGFNLTETGEIEDLDVLDVIYRVTNDTDDDKSLRLINDSFALVEGVVFANFSIVVTELFLDMDPPEDNILADPNLLGPQTIIFPRFNLGDIRLTANFDMDVFLDNKGDAENAFLKDPFTYTLDEHLTLVLEWDNFDSVIAALFALDLNELLTLHLTPVIEEVVDCLFSTFFVTPRVAGATFNADAIRINVTGYDDAVAYALTQVVNLLIPIYQPVLPQVVESVVQDLLVNATLVDPAFCPDADVAGQELLYDFSTGIFKDISDLATAELFEELLSFIDDPDNTVDLLGSNPVEFGFGLPSRNGFEQNVSFAIDKVYIAGLLPPAINEVLLLYVDNTSALFPQGINNIVDIANNTHPVTFTLDMSLNLSEPVAVEAGAVRAIDQIAQTNVIRIVVSFTQIRLILDLYAHYTKYAVDSMEIGKVIELDCWIGRLNESGGIKNLTGVVDSLLDDDFITFVAGTCNCPDNLILEGLVDALTERKGWAPLLDDINFILDAVGGGFALAYNEDNFDTTVENAQKRCANETLPEEQSARLKKLEEEFGTSLTLIGMVFAGVSATSVLACSSACYKRRKGIKRGGVLSITDEDFEADHDYEGFSIFMSPLTPLAFRIGVPLILFGNLVMFLIGDTGDAAIISVEATAIGVSFGVDNFQTLSVISSVFKLWEGGAVLLAIMLFTMSIFFPYFKIFCLTSCWFLPPKYLSTRARGRLIHTLDTLGKWSFVEFFFLIFVLIAFSISGTSPAYAYLPEDPILEASLIIEPQISLFTFGLAVVVSLLMGNVCLIFHARIMERRRLEWRKKKIREIEEYRSKGQGISVDEDSLHIAVRNWEFTIIPHAANPGGRYMFRMTKFGVGVLFAFAIFTVVLLLLASVLPAVLIEQYGLVAYLIEFSGQPTAYTLSVIDLFTESWKQLTPVTFLLGVVVIMTITIVPLFQYLMSTIMILRPMTLHGARGIQMAHHILLTWCCVDVFVFAIAFACLEVGTLSNSLVKAIEQCTDIGEFMEETLLPLGIVTQKDADASCFALIALPEIGAFFGVFAVIFFNVSQYYTAHVFHMYINDRSRIEADLFNDPVKYDVVKTKPTGFHKYLSVLMLIKFIRGRSHIKSQAIAVGGTLTAPPAESIGGNAAANPLFYKNRNMEKARKKKEAEERQKERMETYEVLHPRNKLLNDLTLFLRKVDPAKEHLAEALVDEAFQREGGLQRLSEKLLEKYGATVSINI